jgi:polar amino acid transport system substrate-binding protein
MAPMRSSLLVLALFATLSVACEAPRVRDYTTVAVATDIPPFIMKGATVGIEIDIMQLALPTHALRFIQMPYDQLQSAVAMGFADVAVGVQQSNDGAFYSRDLVTFENAAIVKKSAGLTLESMADLAGHRVLTWQDAYKEVGPRFESMYAPGGAQRMNYVEFADQAEQVRKFWEAEADIAVIDRSIFAWFSVEQRQSLTAVDQHLVFPLTTDFKAAFMDDGLRDVFDRNLASLCESGEYARVLKTYKSTVSRTICDP